MDIVIQVRSSTICTLHGGCRTYIGARDPYFHSDHLITSNVSHSPAKVDEVLMIEVPAWKYRHLGFHEDYNIQFRLDTSACTLHRYGSKFTEIGGRR